MQRQWVLPEKMVIHNGFFAYTQNHHLIEEGNNELTAKISCVDNPDSTKYYSLNVT
jgi:hypothetical protein